MKKHKLKLFGPIVALSATMMMVASCKKDVLDTSDLQIVGVERTINATAAIPQDGDKAYLDYTDGRKVKWELTDAININGTNLALSSLNADPTKAYFEGSVYAIPSGSQDIYWAVYPATIAGAATGSSIPSDFTASTLTVNFPTTQTYNSSSNALSGNTLMAGYASVPAGDEHILFQMRNLGTILKLTLKADASATNKQATKIEFTTTNGALAGAFSVSNGSTPTVTPTANVTKVLTVNLTDGTNNYIDLSSAKDIYVILPPMASKNLTMTIYNTQKKQTNKTVASATLERNNIYTNTISDLCFCECGGGTPYFSVSATKQVVFAPGNLQWSATNGGSTATTHATADGLGGAGTWRFAEHQWDAIGAANSNISYSYSGWLDLFGWGTSGYDNAANDPYAIYFQPWASSLGIVDATYNYYGYGPSTNMADLNLVGTSAYYDWGVYNEIFNPKTSTTDPAGTWRTPTSAEWTYIINTRTTCSGVRYALATVNNMPGLIIVPDNWDVNTYALSSINDDRNAAFTANTISSTDWTNIFEPAGCAFLPAAGLRRASGLLYNVGDGGFYHSATYQNSIGAYQFFFYGSNVYTGASNSRCWGTSVRLVKEVK